MIIYIIFDASSGSNDSTKSIRENNDNNSLTITPELHWRLQATNVFSKQLKLKETTIILTINQSSHLTILEDF